MMFAPDFLLVSVQRVSFGRPSKTPAGMCGALAQLVLDRVAPATQLHTRRTVSTRHSSTVPSVRCTWGTTHVAEVCLLDTFPS